MLLPCAWVVYAVAVVVWLLATSQPFEIVIRFLTVAASIVLLTDAWITPILSARVLRAIALINSPSPNRNTVVLAGYLESPGRNGRWIRGNILSLGVLTAIFVWSLLSVWFPRLAGTEDSTIFFAAYAPFLLLFLWAYERELHRLSRRAAAQGLVLQPVGIGWLSRH